MNHLIIRVALSACLLTVLSTGAAAQVTIRAGSRVRLEAPTLLSKRIEGRLTAARGDSVTIDFTEHGNAPRTTALTLPTSAVTKLEMQAGRSRGRGALRGALIGGLVGLGFAAATSGDRNSDARSAGDSISAGTYAAAGAFVFGGLGAALGGAIGVERWVRVGPPVRVGLVFSRRDAVRAGALGPRPDGR